MVDSIISFSRFLDLVRQRAGEEQNESVEETLSSVIAANEGWTDVAIVHPLNEDDEFEETAFDTLLSSPQIRGLTVASCLPSLLARALLKITCLKRFAFYEFPMTASEAEDIFSSLCSCTVAQKLHLTFGMNGAYDDGVILAFCRFLREFSSLDVLTLRVFGLYQVPNQERSISISSFDSICCAISESKSLQMLDMRAPVAQDNVDRAAESLAAAIANSNTLNKFLLSPNDSLFTFDIVCQALLRKNVVRNSNLCFIQPDLRDHAVRHAVQQQQLVLFFRRCWWKDILAVRDVPVQYWPYLLAKANHSPWKSHKPEDVVFSLLKEKNDVLCRDVYKSPSKTERRTLTGQKRKRDKCPP